MYYLVCESLLYLVHVFFFFKQKTAYEMRISDWSSDVCSSDLPKERNTGQFVFSRLEPPANDLTRSHRHTLISERAHGGVDLRRENAPRTPRHKIGRASCRERVCQYV